MDSLFKNYYCIPVANESKTALQQYLSTDDALCEWVSQQQSMASGDSRQLAAMVMGITSSLPLPTTLLDNLTTNQKLPSDPSLLRGFENERTKGNSLLRKVWSNNRTVLAVKFLYLDFTCNSGTFH